MFQIHVRVGILGPKAMVSTKLKLNCSVKLRLGDSGFNFKFKTKNADYGFFKTVAGKGGFKFKATTKIFNCCCGQSLWITLRAYRLLFVR